jgi:RNA-directed DNA polymerase
MTSPRALRVVTGFFAYHAVPTNFDALYSFRDEVIRIWRRVLRRRSQRDHTTWSGMFALAGRYLPKPRTLHPWPTQRFVVTHPRWEPGAGKPHAGICAGGVQ